MCSGLFVLEVSTHQWHFGCTLLIMQDCVVDCLCCYCSAQCCGGGQASMLWWLIVFMAGPETLDIGSGVAFALDSVTSHTQLH